MINKKIISLIVGTAILLSPVFTFAAQPSWVSSMLQQIKGAQSEKKDVKQAVKGISVQQLQTTSVDAWTPQTGTATTVSATQAQQVTTGGGNTTVTQVQQTTVTSSSNTGTGTTSPPCTSVPPGHLIAPGWLKKFFGIKPAISPCQQLPPGIAKKIPPEDLPTYQYPTPSYPTPAYPTPSPATTTPIITTNVSATNINLGQSVYDNAYITYGNHPTGTLTFAVYGPNDQYCTHLADVGTTTVAGNGSYYSDVFTPVATGTYRFMATYSGDLHNAMVKTQCLDASEMVTVHGTTTPPVATTTDTTPPFISNVFASTTPHLKMATLSWDTNENATSKIWFDNVNPIILSNSTSTTTPGLTMNHDVNLGGLDFATTYYFVIVSSDAAGNTATSSPFSFNTPPF